MQHANYQAVTKVILYTLSPLFLHIFALLCISVFNISDSMRCSVAVLQLQNSLSPYRKYANIILYIYKYI